MAKITCALTWLLAHHKELRIDQAKGINNDLTLNRLDRIDNDGDRTRVQLLEGLLSVNVDR